MKINAFLQTMNFATFVNNATSSGTAPSTWTQMTAAPKEGNTAACIHLVWNSPPHHQQIQRPKAYQIIAPLFPATLVDSVRLNKLSRHRHCLVSLVNWYRLNMYASCLIVSINKLNVLLANVFNVIHNLAFTLYGDPPHVVSAKLVQFNSILFA